MNYPSRDAARRIRRDLVRMHRRGPCIGSAMSAADVIASLYAEVMNIPSPDDPDRDRFILSKGHAAAALYAALALRGFIDREDLAGWSADGSPLTTHPSRGNLPGIEASTGSLGHGLAIGVGIAWGLRMEGRPSRTFVLLGDGECQEGSVWEAAGLGARLSLENLTAIVDANRLQGYARADEIQPTSSLAGKFSAFGWAAREIDGHDHDALAAALRARLDGTPTAIVAHTVKGKGIKQMEDQLGWHYFNVTEEQLPGFLAELGEPS